MGDGYVYLYDGLNINQIPFDAGGAAKINDNGVVVWNKDDDNDYEIYLLQSDQRRYIIEAGDYFLEDWNSSEAYQLYTMYKTDLEFLIVDNVMWYKIDIDFDQYGSWGNPHSIGDYWSYDDYQYIYLDYGVGFSTDSNPIIIPEPATLILLCIGIGSLLGRKIWKSLLSYINKD